MNSLDPYLESFNSIYWNIPAGGDLRNIKFADTEESIISDPIRYQQLLQPLTTGPIKIYFQDENENRIAIQYPAGMTAIHILGAINTFYDQPISQQFLSELKQFPEQYDLRYYPIAAEKIRLGRIVPTRRDFLADHSFFVGLIKYNDGYAVITRTI